MANLPEGNPEIPQQANEPSDTPIGPQDDPTNPDQALDNNFKRIALITTTAGIAAIGVTAAILTIDHAKKKEQQGDKKPRRTVREVLLTKFRRQK